MRFPNASKGVKKLFVSELFNIISTILVFAVAVFSTQVSDNVSLENGDNEAYILIGFFAASTFFSVIAFIVQLVGLNQARRDEKLFKKAMYFVLICGVSTIVLSFSGYGMFGRIFAGIDEISTLLVNVYIIISIHGLADQLGNKRIQTHGKVTLLIVTIMFAVTFFFQLAMAIAPEITENLSVVNSMIEFVGYFVILVFLFSSARMFAKS